MLRPTHSTPTTEDSMKLAPSSTATTKVMPATSSGASTTQVSPISPTATATQTLQAQPTPENHRHLIPIPFEFRYSTATTVAIAGDFNGWNPTASMMHPTGGGRWSTSIPLPHGRHEYRMVVDGVWMPDPQAMTAVANPYGGSNSVVLVPPLDHTNATTPTTRTA